MCSDMGDREYKRDGNHDELFTKVDFDGQMKFVAAEVICWGLLHIGNGLYRIADSLKGTSEEPAWAHRLERNMADLATALANLQAADQNVVDELQKLADEVRNAPDVQAAADAVQAEADRLQAAVDDAEAAPADPGTGGDQPPADQPPTA